MKRPEAVLFDFGNVLVSIHPERFLGTLGLDNEAARVRYRQEIISIVERYERADATTAQAFEAFTALFDHRFSRDEIRKAMLNVIGDAIPGVEPLVRQVSMRAKIALVSNTNELHFNHCLDRLPVLKLFPRYFLSYQLGISKPESLYYKKVLDILSIPPSDILFIDDVPENVRGAESVGMKGIVFSDPSQLERELTAFQLL